MYENEARFYRDVRHELDSSDDEAVTKTVGASIAAPKVYGTIFDKQKCMYGVFMEDLRLRSARFPNSLGGLTVAELRRLLIRQTARRHIGSCVEKSTHALLRRLVAEELEDPSRRRLRRLGQARLRRALSELLAERPGGRLLLVTSDDGRRPFHSFLDRIPADLRRSVLVSTAAGNALFAGTPGTAAYWYIASQCRSR